MEESTWVRSMYLYLMCFVSIVLIAMGTVAVGVGIVHAIAPDLGHRDAVDRIGIGASNIADGILDIMREQSNDSASDYCDHWQEDDYYESRSDCMRDNSGMDAEGFGAISKGITEVRSELRGQIRNSSLNAVIRGLISVIAGLILFRLHARHTTLYANGISSLKKPTAATPPPPPVAMV